jgi:hypothetical protein
VLSSAGERPASNEVAESGTARTIEAPEAQPVDLLRTAGAPVLKRVVPVAATIVIAIVVVLILLLR